MQPITTASEFAASLNGRTRGPELTKDEEAQAKAAGLVVVFGESDDLVELRGAIHDEIGAYDGTTVYLTSAGLVKNECDDEECPRFKRARQSATTIEALWCANDQPWSWSFQTTIPHATFEIHDEGEEFCLGIVFALADVGKEAESDPNVGKWCFFHNDDGHFTIAANESEAHARAQERVDNDCEIGVSAEYTLARVAHPVDIADWKSANPANNARRCIAHNVINQIDEWAGEETGAEAPTIDLTPEDIGELGDLIFNFVRSRAKAQWYGVQKGSETKHTYIAGSVEQVGGA
jgi:hypothetical protein